MNLLGPVHVVGLLWLFFSPRGRLSRRLFIQGWLFWACLFGACLIVVGGEITDTNLVTYAVLGMIVVTPLWIISTLMMGFKRVHDMGIPGPVALVLLLPGPGLAAVVLFALWPPRMEGNPYGDVRNGWL